jgi:outer membrane protein assembly factor BamB
MRVLLAAALMATLARGLAAASSTWPQFRGPLGNGQSPASNVPVRWSETNNLVWKVAVPGRGRSSPVVLGDRVWLTLAVEKGVVRKRISGDDMQTAEHVSLEAVCLDGASGQIVWRTKLFAWDHPDPVHWLNSWATPTPVVEPDRLYCDFGTFGTACLDAASGRVIWKTRLPVDHQVGPGSSPVVYLRLLILVRDGRDAQYVTALDKRTGKEVWKTDRPPIAASSGNLKKSFVTPLLVSAAGRMQLLAPGAQWLVSYDPATGREHWRVRHGEGFSIGSCPVFREDTVFFSTGCMKPQLWAVRVDGEGDVTATHVKWTSTRQVPILSSPVLSGNEIYWVSDDGMANGADARSGEVHWQERLGGKHYASPLVNAGRIYFFGNDGTTTVVRTGTEFEKLAANRIEGQVTATPAIVDGAIFLRTDTHLYRIGSR